MARELWRLTQDLYNTPHLVTQEAFEKIEKYLSLRNSGEAELLQSEANDKTMSSNIQAMEGVGFISVMGMLTYRASMFEALCGMMSYQTITKSFDAYAKEGIKTIVLMADGPGGQAYGAFETGRYMREAADAKGIKLIAYVDGLAASATYAIAASAHEVIINPEATAGSIGVVVSLLNNSKNLEKNGYERTFVYAGDNKIPYTEDGSFREDFIQEIQTRVDTLYQDFINYVADMRSISPEDVKNTKASVFGAREALDIGLVTSVKTRQEFNSYLQTLSSKSSKTATNLGVKMEQEELLVQMQAELQAAKEQLAQMQEQNVKLAEEAKTKAIAELTAQAAAWEFAGVDAAAYAVAAYEGSVPVSMFSAAMDKASEALSAKETAIQEMKDQLEAMESLGDETPDATPEKQEDKVLAAAAKHAAAYNVRIKQ